MLRRLRKSERKRMGGSRIQVGPSNRTIRRRSQGKVSDNPNYKLAGRK